MSPSASGAPKKTVDIYEVATHLWGTADELRANSHLKAAEYSIPVLGLIFLKFADSRFAEAEADLAGKATSRRSKTSRLSCARASPGTRSRASS